MNNNDVERAVILKEKNVTNTTTDDAAVSDGELACEQDEQYEHSSHHCRRRAKITRPHEKLAHEQDE